GDAGKRYYQLSVPELIEEAIKNREGQLVDSGAITADTGWYTGRSPKDRFIVKDSITADAVWWGDINRPIEATVFDRLFEKVGDYLGSKTIYVRDVLAWPDPAHQTSVRVVSESAYQSMFAHNMF